MDNDWFLIYYKKQANNKMGQMPILEIIVVLQTSILYYWLSVGIEVLMVNGAANPAIAHAGMLNEQKSWPISVPCFPLITLPRYIWGSSKSVILYPKLAGRSTGFSIGDKAQYCLEGIAVKVCHH